MQTSYIPNTLLRAAVNDNTLFIFDDVKDETVLTVTNVIPSSQELAQRNFNSLEEYFNVEILRIIEDELSLQLLDIGTVIKNLIYPPFSVVKLGI